MSIQATAASGVSTALVRFEASASRTVANPLQDPVGETVERLQAEIDVRANVAVLRTANDMMGTLLDIRV